MQLQNTINYETKIFRGMYFRDVAMEKRFLHYVYMKTQEFITCCIYFVIHGNVTSMFF